VLDTRASPSRILTPVTELDAHCRRQLVVSTRTL